MSTDRIKRINNLSTEVSKSIDDFASTSLHRISTIKDHWLSDNYLKIKGKPIPTDCNSNHLLEWRIIERPLPNGGSHMTLLHLEQVVSIIIINVSDMTVYYTIEDIDGKRNSGYASL